ncbi:MAG: LysM peptidoglycan-binding domain-containing protein [Cyclobacteriaceae bacterium]|nr:LysM peptidoglycan-binding domain-containing protein [Cyclobacteriaceae bacterium]MCX7637918.1 LysM peptidoglycan-binding domain-containing protein [Cyclobacteriaceae bacterium]MDW8331462.1 LysM peptidoglycan-binding domain-containing protein [Cyclobacteriaceae bacterium]
MLKILIFWTISFAHPAQADSIGTEVINGKLFVIHKVDEKETLFSISRRYGTPIAQILEYNPSADAGLEVGQILKIPYTPRTVRRAGNDIIHKVSEKETLFSISRQYQVTVDEIKQWNNLTDNTLAVGQELIIRKSVQPSDTRPVTPQPMEVRTVHTVAAGETLFSISRRYGVTVEQIKQWNNLTGQDLKAGQKLFVAQPVYEQNNATVPNTQTVAGVTTNPSEPSNMQTSVTEKAPVTVIPAETLGGTKEIKESGLAELIEGTEGNRKYLALHRTAPVGTILKVRNEMNNREVFVRVIGKLPDTALNDKLIIKISKSAYDRLGAIDPRFRVEVTFYQ